MSNDKLNKTKPSYVDAMISCRISQETFLKLQDLQKSDILKVLDGFGIHNLRVEKARSVRKKSYDKGRDSGSLEQWDLLAVQYPCSKCGNGMYVIKKEEKEALKNYIVSQGWHHDYDCQEFIMK